MEDSERINGKKRLPSIPSNYVTLRQLQERWIKEKGRKQKGEQVKDEPPQEEGKETKVEERVHDDEVAGRGSRKNGHFRHYNWGNGKRVAEGKRMEEKTAVGFAVDGSVDADSEKKGEELKTESKKKKKKNWKNKKKSKEEEKARADEGEEPPPASTENNNEVEEEVIGDEVHAPKLASVEARRDSQQRFIPRTHGPTAEIDQKFTAMSMKGEIRTGDYRRYGRQNGNLDHRGGNPKLNRRYYGNFDRRREQRNQRNEGMVWVKKGEVNDRNVNGIQSLSCSSKELD